MRKEITLLRSSNSHHNDGPVCHTDTAVTIFIFAVWIEIYIYGGYSENEENGDSSVRPAV